MGGRVEADGGEEPMERRERESGEEGVGNGRESGWRSGLGKFYKNEGGSQLNSISGWIHVLVASHFRSLFFSLLLFLFSILLLFSYPPSSSPPLSSLLLLKRPLA